MRQMVRRTLRRANASDPVDARRVWLAGIADRPNLAGIAFAAAFAVVYALMTIAQWAGWGGWAVLPTGADDGSTAVIGEALYLGLVNLGFGLLTIASVVVLRPMPRTWMAKLLLIGGVAFVWSLPRALVMVTIHSTPSSAVFLLAEWFAGFFAGFLSVVAGVLISELLFLIRDVEQARLQGALMAARAVEELQSEEIRVRRMVADHLHGTLQYRLVTVTAGLDVVASNLAGGQASAPEAAAELQRIASTLDEVREGEVRVLSHSVFPAGIELGIVTALEAMLRRVPPPMMVSIETGPGYEKQRLAERAHGDRASVTGTAADRDSLGATPQLDLAERLVAYYVVEEAISNALRHGRATAVRVALDAHRAPQPRGGWVLDVRVDDNGEGLSGSEPTFSGLLRHADRLRHRGGELALSAAPVRGACLSFTLPFGGPGGVTPEVGIG